MFFAVSSFCSNIRFLFLLEIHLKTTIRSTIPGIQYKFELHTLFGRILSFKVVLICNKHHKT